MALADRFENGEMMTVAVGLAVIGSYLTICFCEQFRLCSVGGHTSKLLSKSGLFALMTLSFGGVGVWSFNFVAYSALSVKLQNGSFCHVDIQLIPMMSAFVILMTFALLGLYVSSLDKMFAKSKQQIVEQFVAESSKLSMRQIQKITNL